LCPSADPPTAPSEEDLQLLFALLFSSPEPVTLDRIREVLLRRGEGAGSDRPEGVAEDGPAAAAEADRAPGDGPPEGADTADAAAGEERFSPREYLDALEAWLEERGVPLVLRRVGRSFRLLTRPEFAPALERVRRQAATERLGPATLEVLALVAYRQPVLKADVDAIRGVQSGGHLRHLLDLRLVRILGRADLPGRPFLYGTTREFLDAFGLSSLDDLPEAGRLKAPAEALADSEA